MGFFVVLARFSKALLLASTKLLTTKHSSFRLGCYILVPFVGRNSMISRNFGERESKLPVSEAKRFQYIRRKEKAIDLNDMQDYPTKKKR